MATDRRAVVVPSPPLHSTAALRALLPLQVKVVLTAGALCTVTRHVGQPGPTARALVALARKAAAAAFSRMPHMAATCARCLRRLACAPKCRVPWTALFRFGRHGVPAARRAASVCRAAVAPSRRQRSTVASRAQPPNKRRCAPMGTAPCTATLRSGRPGPTARALAAPARRAAAAASSRTPRTAATCARCWRRRARAPRRRAPWTARSRSGSAGAFAARRAVAARRCARALSPLTSALVALHVLW